MNNAIKIIGIIFCLIPMVGFGLCGLIGLNIGVTSHGMSGDTAIIFLLALLGLGIAAAFAFFAWKLFGSLAGPDDAKR